MDRLAARLHNRTMLFADSALVRRIEDAERRLTTDVAAIIQARDPRVLVMPIAGGAAVHVGEEAPFNKLIGAGLDGPFDEAALAALDSIERAFDARRTPLQAEVATLADNAVPSLLTRRGYALVAFENVLGLRLDRAAGLDGPTPPGVEIAAAGGAETDAWIDAMVTGFASPDAVPGGASHESFPREPLARVMRDTARATGFSCYLARLDGVTAGGAGLRVAGGIAQLCGSATLPALRRRGVQTALLTHRLRDAAAAGCDVAVITTQPGSKSQENAQRRGFALLYSRAILVRERG